MKLEIIPVPEGPQKDQINSALAVVSGSDLFKGPWLAGGAARRLLLQEPLLDGDLDFFFRDENSIRLRRQLVEALASKRFVSKLATTFTVDTENGEALFQTINRKFYTDLPAVFEDFDFTICQFATDGEYIAGTPEAFRDLKSKTLRFTGNAIKDTTTIRRVLKYINYGFVADTGILGTTAKLASRNQLNNSLNLNQIESNYQPEDIKNSDSKIAWEILNSQVGYSPLLKKIKGVISNVFS